MMPSPWAAKPTGEESDGSTRRRAQQQSTQRYPANKTEGRKGTDNRSGETKNQTVFENHHSDLAVADWLGRGQYNRRDEHGDSAGDPSAESTDASDDCDDI